MYKSVEETAKAFYAYLTYGPYMALVFLTPKSGYSVRTDTSNGS